MDVLMLGGTAWLGREIARAAVAAGDSERPRRELLSDLVAWEREQGLGRERQAGLGAGRQTELVARLIKTG